MFTKQKLITLVLISFCSVLILNSHSKIEKVAASEAVWKEVDTIEDGKAYLITAEKNGVTYYLPTGTKTIGTKQGDNLNFTNTDAYSHLWKFNYDGQKYQIIDASGNILYAYSPSSITYNILASNNVNNVDKENKYWKLENNELKSGINLEGTLTYDVSNGTWHSKAYSGRVSSLKFYILTAYGEASSFAAWIMEQQDGNIVTPECSAKYSEAKVRWNELTFEAQELIKSNSSFSDTLLRLTNWATANGETIEEFYNNSVAEVRREKGNNNGIIYTLIFSILLISGLLVGKKIKVKD